VEELEEEVMSYTEILIRKIDPTIVVAGEREIFGKPWLPPYLKLV
jgi:hypothetical protein